MWDGHRVVDRMHRSNFDELHSAEVELAQQPCGSAVLLQLQHLLDGLRRLRDFPRRIDLDTAD